MFLVAFPVASGIYLAHILVSCIGLLYDNFWSMFSMVSLVSPCGLDKVFISELFFINNRKENLKNFF